jgi:hypothetical protein
MDFKLNNLNLNNIFGIATTKKRKRKVKRASTTKSKTPSPKPPTVINGQFVFPMGGPGTGAIEPITVSSKSKSSHKSYLTKGTVTAEEVVTRIETFIDTFFKEHAGDKLTVDDLIKESGEKDLIKYIKPMPETVTAEIIGSGGFGNAFVAADPTKIVKVIKFYDRMSRFFNVQLIDIILEVLIQYIIQNDATHPEIVPVVHGIYCNKEKDTIYVVMDRLDKTLDNIFEAGRTSIATFKDLIGQVLEILIYLNNTYGFVHRDLKGNNIMVKVEKVMRVGLRTKGREVEVNRVRLIDFGFSAMNLEYADGKPLRISSTHSFRNDSPCRGRQDTTFLFVYLNGHRDWFDAKTKEFLDEILAPVAGIRSWGFAYNRDGKLLACPTTKILDPPAALRRLKASA